MKIEDLKPNIGAVAKKKRLGRGNGTGLGKTAGRGGKGQTARSGASIRAGFEGGQTPLYKRIAKRGFTSGFSHNKTVINLNIVESYVDSSGVFDGSLLHAKSKQENKVKLLGTGVVPKILKQVKNVEMSKEAKEKLVASGVKVEG